jgi:uncharacterized membrane protein (DUF373 family)
MPLMKNKRGVEPCESFLSLKKKFKLFFFVFAAFFCLVLTSLFSNPCALNYIINFSLLSVNRSVILMRKLFFFCNLQWKWQKLRVLPRSSKSVELTSKWVITVSFFFLLFLNFMSCELELFALFFLVNFVENKAKDRQEIATS